MSDARAMRIGILASGRGSNAEAIIAAAHDGRLDAEVVTLISDRAGVPVVGIGLGLGVRTCVFPRPAFESRADQQRAIRDELLSHDVDVVALAGYEAILDSIVVDAFDGRILNIHPSLLPAFGGLVAPEPQRRALESGATETGCTIHIVTSEVDAGPILERAVVPILPDDTVESLSDRILAEEHRLYPEVLQRFTGDPDESPPAESEALVRA